MGVLKAPLREALERWQKKFQCPVAYDVAVPGSEGRGAGVKATRGPWILILNCSQHEFKPLSGRLLNVKCGSFEDAKE